MKKFKPGQRVVPNADAKLVLSKNPIMITYGLFDGVSVIDRYEDNRAAFYQCCVRIKKDGKEVILHQDYLDPVSTWKVTKKDSK